MDRYYAGIGSRQTPHRILRLMRLAARKLAETGWVLRSGGAQGADSAFEVGCTDTGPAGLCEIYLPWARFNGHLSPLVRPTDAAIRLAGEFHPAWERCNRIARLLHARNCHQILGASLHAPVKFVLCWHDGSGGTMQAVRLADARGIPVYNLRDTEVEKRIGAYVDAPS